MGGTTSKSKTKKSESNSFCDEVKNILKPYIDLARQHPIQKVGISVPFLKGDMPNTIPLVTLAAYVYIANGSIQSYSDFELPYIQCVYQLAGVTNTCNGIIGVEYLGFRKEPDDMEIYKNPVTRERYGYDRLVYSESTKDKFKPYLSFQPRGRGFIYTRVKLEDSDTDTMKDNNRERKTLFTEKFTDQYNKCTFISVAANFFATDNGHANMLLIYRDKIESNTVYLMLYEPHGADGIDIIEPYKTQYQIMKSQFMEFIKNTIIEIYREQRKKSPVFPIVNPYKISQKDGIQSYMKDKNGFCYMITSFWLYITLKLVTSRNIKHEDNTQLLLNLNYIEECVFNIIEQEIVNDTKPQLPGTAASAAAGPETSVEARAAAGPETSVEESASSSTIPQILKALQVGSFKNYTADEVLYSLIVHFSYSFLTQFYLNYFTPDNLNFKRFVTEFSDTYNKKSRDREKFKYIHIKDIEYEQRDEANITPERLTQIRRNAEGRIIGKYDGHKCEENEECQSVVCKNKICVPHDYNDQKEEERDIQNVSTSKPYSYYNIITDLFYPRKERIEYIKEGPTHNEEIYGSGYKGEKIFNDFKENKARKADSHLEKRDSKKHKNIGGESILELDKL